MPLEFFEGTGPETWGPLRIWKLISFTEKPPKPPSCSLVCVAVFQ